MSDISDYFNQNQGYYNALGQMAAIGQRNQLLAGQRQQIASLERQYAQIQRTEAERLELEKLRAKAEAEERALRQEQLERLKQIRNFMADTIAGFERFKQVNP